MRELALDHERAVRHMPASRQMKRTRAGNRHQAGPHRHTGERPADLEDAFLQGGRRVLVELRMRVGRRRARTRTGTARIEVAFRVERHGGCPSLRAREEMMLSPNTAVKGLIR